MATNIAAGLKYNKDAVILTGSARRGLSISVRDEGVGVGAPTLQGENLFMLQKAYNCPPFFWR